ncbi:restriction endonuclease subunit S [Thermaerobacillus caldiproteolyticus]|uniref:restriction endonuclease subunit S n=1 Tax=Thermaerobacillus caldiproteolyticus TaxID=247480 RepID=UPI00188D8802|nr:restriction endonuclease subunit S [Anoxybacillus caldiproteolyticus]QPA32221.1 restriction endonuclease subunit S [Anoxybacillus caldiproteolyticus]
MMGKKMFQDVPLGELFDISTKSIKPDDTPNKEFWHYSIPAYDDNKQPVLDMGEKIKSNKYLLDQDSILVSKLNPRIKRVWKFEKKYSDRHSICSTEFIVYQSKMPNVDLEYYSQFFLSDIFQKELLMLQNGTTGSRMRVTPSDTLSIPIPFPSIKEQRKIAAILSSVDEAIEKTEAIIEQTEKVKKGLMQQLLTKGIGHTKFKKTEIGEIPEEWEVKTIGELAEKILGGGTPSREVQNYYKGNIPWATVKDITYHILDTTEEYISDEAVENSATNVIPAGNVIIATRIGLGKVFMNTVDMAINQDLKGIIPKTELIEAEYLLWCLLSKAEKIESMGTGTTVKGIRLEQLKEILLPIPQKSEQKRIVSILNNLEEKIKNERKKHITLLLLKKGLMQVLLTGKVRVKVDNEVMSQ